MKPAPQIAGDKGAVIAFAAVIILGLAFYTFRSVSPKAHEVSTAAQASPWDDGYTSGFNLVASEGNAPARVPSGVELDALAERASTGHAASYGHKDEWSRGFRNGYEAAYNKVHRPAF